MPQGLGIVAILDGQPQLHVVVVIDGGVPEPGDLRIAANHDAQRSGNVLRLHLQVRRALAIDPYLELRLVQPQRGVGINDPEVWSHQAQLLGVLGQGFEFRPANGQIQLRPAGAKIDGLDVAH